ncbi:DNA/RNA non-specific endonuclease [Nocardiopsis rhodophaea]|uniref:DNA/RNA non-specific endonuclease n=1 Tax=Nocardiopsis rhodophaea TaxID=280238 RepID=UPI0031CEDE86
MSDSEMVNFKKVFVPDVDPDELETAAAGLKKDGSNIADSGNDIKSAWQGLSEVYSAPESEQLLSAINPVATKGDDIDDATSTVADALLTFAEKARKLKKRLENLRHDALLFFAAHSSDEDWADDEDLREENNKRKTDIDAAFLEYQAAERECANKITPLYDGPEFVADNGEIIPADKRAYGIEEIPEDAAMPWGSTVEPDSNFFLDLGTALWESTPLAMGWDAGVNAAYASGFYTDEGWGVESAEEWWGNVMAHHDETNKNMRALVGQVKVQGTGPGLWGEWEFREGVAGEAWSGVWDGMTGLSQWDDRPGYTIGTSVMTTISFFGGAAGLARGGSRALATAGRAISKWKPGFGSFSPGDGVPTPGSGKFPNPSLDLGGEHGASPGFGTQESSGTDHGPSANSGQGSPGEGYQGSSPDSTGDGLPGRQQEEQGQAAHTPNNSGAHSSSASNDHGTSPDSSSEPRMNQEPQAQQDQAPATPAQRTGSTTPERHDGAGVGSREGASDSSAPARDNHANTDRTTTEVQRDVSRLEELVKENGGDMDAAMNQLAREREPELVGAGVGAHNSDMGPTASAGGSLDSPSAVSGQGLGHSGTLWNSEGSSSGGGPGGSGSSLAHGTHDTGGGSDGGRGGGSPASPEGGRTNVSADDPRTSHLVPEPDQRFGDGADLKPNTTYEVVDSDGKPRGTFITDDYGEIREVHADSDKITSKHPEFLKPRPNTTYSVNGGADNGGYTYRTDGEGRTVSVEGRLEPGAHVRNKDEQDVVNAIGKDYFKALNQQLIDSGESFQYADGKWNGGHLVGAKEFGGTGERLNQTPMLEVVNQRRNTHPGIAGSFRNLEKTWEALLSGDEKKLAAVEKRDGVHQEAWERQMKEWGRIIESGPNPPEIDVQIKNVYDPRMNPIEVVEGGSVKQLLPPPSEVVVRWSLNGVRQERLSYPNVPELIQE